MRVTFAALVAAALMLSFPFVGRAETSESSGGGAERVGAEAPRREEEREAEKKEEEERPAKEAAARAAKEREVRETGERAGRERVERERAEAERNSTASVQCVVPRLKGDSIGAARTALRKGHCVLGRVSQPVRHRGPLVVTTQSARAGSKLADGAAIAVRLRPAKAKRAHGRG
jgi:hypothetical protein